MDIYHIRSGSSKASLSIFDVKYTIRQKMNFGNTDSMGVAFIVTKYMIPLSFSIFLLVLSYNAFDSGFSRPKIFVSFNEFLHISNHVNVRAFLIYLLSATIFTQPSIRAKHVSILNMTII